METTLPASALCIGCNYPLRELAETRCPECGRHFDPVDPRTFNTGRPLLAFDRMILRRIGAPTFLIVVISCASVLWIARHPSVYYVQFHWMLLFLLWVVAGGMVGSRIALRAGLAPRVARAPDRRRPMVLWALLIATTVLVLVHAPLYIEMLILRPGLEQWVRQIESGAAPMNAGTRNIGPFKISQSGIYSEKKTYFFIIDDSSTYSGEGFAYHSGGDSIHTYYNYGADGHLFGNWYWWTDD